jgi:hypothetical protein
MNDVLCRASLRVTPARSEEEDNFRFGTEGERKGPDGSTGRVVFWSGDETDVCLTGLRPLLRAGINVLFFFIFGKVELTVWTDIDRGKPKNSEKNLSQYHFVHHKSHWIDLGANPGRCDERPAMTRLSRGTAGRIVTVRDGTFKGM